MAAAAFIMPFGMHKGKTLDRVPTGYLRWVLENVPALYPETRRAIEDFVRQPAGGPQEPQEPQESPSTPARGSAPRRPRSSPAEGKAAATCGICGLSPTPKRPLVHAACASDHEVPF